MRSTAALRSKFLLFIFFIISTVSLCCKKDSGIPPEFFIRATLNDTVVEFTTTSTYFQEGNPVNVWAFQATDSTITQSFFSIGIADTADFIINKVYTQSDGDLLGYYRVKIMFLLNNTQVICEDSPEDECMLTEITNTYVAGTFSGVGRGENITGAPTIKVKGSFRVKRN